MDKMEAWTPNELGFIYECANLRPLPRVGDLANMRNTVCQKIELFVKAQAAEIRKEPQPTKKGNKHGKSD